ncbi:MAG: helicase-related protein [Thermaerobacter sp.]|nr:helicase-related protein [Thermaerobacter sp.]
MKGVVSTSALELGIDIGDLDVGVQVGVPRSTAALLQRLGRVGRAGPGTLLVVLDDGPYGRLIGQRPDALFTRPLEDTTIYLDNRRIQYIHAMCLAGPGGEGETLGGPDWTMDDAVRATLPAEFLELVAAEQTGQVPADLQTLKSDGGHDPWHSFPLRDTGTSFKAELRAMGDAHRELLGSLTYAQVLHEAYPGAVCYYQGRPYRVRQVSLDRRQVVVGHEKGYVTRPLLVPPMIYPNTAAGWLGGMTHGGLVAGEVDMQVTESVQGWVEFRGRGRTEHRYPSEYWHRDALRRNFFTTGVCLWHPALDEREAKTALCLAAALHEAFLAEVPTDTGDVSAGTGVMRDLRPPVTSTRFITIYDNTYGSLRLTARLFQPDVLGRCLTAAQIILANGLEERDADDDIREAAGVYGYPTEVLRRAADVLGQLVTEWGRPGRAIHEGDAVAPLPATNRPLVIRPGDTGILMIRALTVPLDFI